VNNRLRELRAAHRWSQADLADRLDVSRQTINSIENGRYDPSLPLAFKIAEVFDRPIEDIFSPSVPPASTSERPNHSQKEQNPERTHLEERDGPTRWLRIF
jgi:putative transcriptional regulator